MSRPLLDMRWMDRALELAERGRFTVSPNPMVGAVVVRRGRVVGNGLSSSAGGPSRGGLGARAARERARGERICTCHARALRALRADASVHRRDPRGGYSPPRRRGGRPEPSRRRARVRGAPAGRSPRPRGGAGAAAAAPSCQNEKFLALDHAAAAVRPRQVGQAASTARTATAPEDRAAGSPAGEARQRALLASRGVRRRPGRSRHRPRRRPAPDAASRKELGSRRTGGSSWTAASGFRSARVSFAIRRRDPRRTARSPPSPAVRRLVSRGVTVWSLPGRRPGHVSDPAAAAGSSPAKGSRVSWSKADRPRSGNSSGPGAWTGSRSSSRRASSEAIALPAGVGGDGFALARDAMVEMTWKFKRSDRTFWSPGH